MAFDPNAATARYIDSLGPAALQKAHDYTVGKEWMLLWALLVAALVTWLIVRSGILDRLEAKLGEQAPQPPRLRRRPRLFHRLGGADAAVDHLRRLVAREELRPDQPAARATGSARRASRPSITALSAALFMIGVYWLIRRTGRRWWLWSGALDRSRLAFFMLLAPVLIEPLFNKYTPVPPGQVRDAVVEMAQRAGIPPNKVYMFNGSRQSNNFTANAGGVGSTARVAISDVAFKNASLDEVRAVTGHEIGHYVLKHTWWGILFYLGRCDHSLLARRSHLPVVRAAASEASAAIADPRGVPVLMFMVSLFGFAELAVLQHVQPDARERRPTFIRSRRRTGPTPCRRRS